ncbi:MAG: hypothetical protein HY846_05845 [Nitrosomonadales bacterium]|nr:hypothetical protein [Nitrosomonadales bacterium]
MIQKVSDKKRNHQGSRNANQKAATSSLALQFYSRGARDKPHYGYGNSNRKQPDMRR